MNKWTYGRGEYFFSTINKSVQHQNKNRYKADKTLDPRIREQRDLQKHKRSYKI